MRSLRHRLLVVAPDPAQAVRHAGGWLFDQVMAGWDVTVLTADLADSRPLRILGVRAVDLDDLPADGPAPDLIAVHTEASAYTERVRRLVQAAQGTSDVWLWGEQETRLNALDVIRHTPSAAARAFKSQALAAAGIAAQVPGDDEVFRRFCGVLPEDRQADVRFLVRQ